MKVLSFGPLPPEYGGTVAGGVATYHAAMVKALSDYCPSIETITIVPNRLIEHPKKLPYKCTIERLTSSDRVPNRLMQLVDTYDVIIVHHLTNNWCRAFVDAGLGDKIVGICHSWTALLHDPSLGVTLQRIIDSCSEVVFPSYHSMGQGKFLGIDVPESAEVIYAPLVEPFLTGGHNGRRQGVLFAASLIDLKQCELLVRAIATMSGKLKLTIAGDGPLRDTLEELVQSLSLTHRVTFLGSLSHEELAVAYSNHEVFCMPSRSESLGLTYVEALSFGTPVVGYAPSIKELSTAIGTSCGISFTGGGIEDLAIALREALDRVWNHERLSEGTRKVFSPAMSVKRMVRVMRRAQSD